MNRILLIAAVALALPAAALAKGPSEAVLTGPGLDTGITLSGLGDSSQLVSAAGFFPATFGQEPDPMLASPPKGDLGPRYTLTYTVPGPSGTDDTIVQDVFPYATPSPVTYSAPGQPFFGGQRTHGGWYVAAPTLRTLLVRAGLPAAPAPTGGGSGTPVWPWLAAALGLLVALGWAAWFARARWISTTRTPSVS
jgi:hypothetical protein